MLNRQKKPQESIHNIVATSVDNYINSSLLENCSHKFIPYTTFIKSFNKILKEEKISPNYIVEVFYMKGFCIDVFYKGLRKYVIVYKKAM